MAETTTDSPLERFTVVDCDVHAGVDLDAVVPYVERGPVRSGIRRLSEIAGPLDLYDRRMDDTVGDQRVDGPEDVERDLREGLGIDHPILTPINVYLDARTPRKDLVVPLMRATNDWLLDHYLDGHDAFRLCAPVTTRDPAASAEELDRLGGERGVVGAFVFHTAASPPLGDPEYDVLYRAAEDNGLPVVFHGGTSALQYGFPRLDESLQTWFEAGFLSHSFTQQLTLLSLTRNGVFEKFPDLSFVFLEAGVSWVVHAVFRLNTIYAKRAEEAPLLERAPEEYVRERCYFGTQPLGEPTDPEHLRQVVEMVGPRSILFASDYPHWDFDHPSVLDLYSLDLPDADLARIMGENAAGLFGL